MVVGFGTDYAWFDMPEEGSVNTIILQGKVIAIGASCILAAIVFFIVVGLFAIGDFVQWACSRPYQWILDFNRP